MIKYSPRKIFKLAEGWKEKMDNSWQRGQDNINFTEFGQQGFNDSGTFQQKEQMIFNLANKILKSAQANGKNIELKLDVFSPTINNSSTEDVKDKRISRAIVSEIMLNNTNKTAFSTSLDKVYAFGQSVYHIKACQENSDTLNQVLKIETLKDPTKAFFDYDAPSPTFHDGQFCGRIYEFTRKNIIKMYKNLRNADLKDKVEVIDFWYKSTKRVDYVLLTTGEYKREDLIDPLRDSIKVAPSQKGWITTLNYVRCIKDHPNFIEKQLNISCDCLPMVMDYGNFVWNGKQFESFPLGFHIRDTQQLMNYAGSTLADILKSSQADKWLLSAEHVKSDDARSSAEEINTREGGLIFTGNIQTIRRESSQQLPPTISEFFLNLQQVLQNIAGSYFDGNSAEMKAMSGVALDKMFNRADLVQNNTIVAHIESINIVGDIVRQMLPLYYKEERQLTINAGLDAQATITINKRVTQPNTAIETVENDINDLSKNYRFKIMAAPSTRLQKQNTQIELAQLYQLFQPAIASTIDIYAKSLDIPDADEISRRLGVNIPKPLVEYGRGEINDQQYQQFVQQQMMQSQQMQQQAIQNNPETQYMQAKASGEISRAQTAKYEAQTARIKEANAATNDHINAVSDAVKTEMDNKNAEEERKLQYIKAAIQHLNDMLKIEGNR